MANGTKAPKGALIAGLVLIMAGFAGCGYGCVSFFGIIGDVSDAISSANTTPLNSPTTLVATGEAGILLTSDSSARCLVNDPSGSEVTIQEPGAGTSGTLEVGGERLELAYYFETTVGTTYDVICGDEAGTTSGSYAVAPIPSFDGVGGIFTGGISGVVLFFIGLILLIVGLVQRSKWKKNRPMAPPGGFTPAGGVAPPGGAVPPPPGGFGSPSAPPLPPVPPAPGTAAPPPQSPPPQSPPPPVPPAPGTLPPGPGMPPPQGGV